MPFTPFEQLEFFVPEPTRAFGQVVETLLRERFGPSAVQPCDAQGCLVADLPEGLSLYQPKYFLKDWQGSQRQQIREAFQQALQRRNNPPPRRWVLCVPGAITPKDSRWFDRWCKTQPIAIEVLEGDELLRMLIEPSGSRARELIRTWGVGVPEAEPARVHGRLRVSAAEPRSGLSHYLYVSLYHSSSHPTKGLKVELAHSPTRHFTLQQDEREWADEGRGNLNPRSLRACRPLLPKEDRLVAVIPIGPHTPLPLCLGLKLSRRTAASVEQHLTVDQRALETATQFDFLAGPSPDLVLTETGTNRGQKGDRGSGLGIRRTWAAGGNPHGDQGPNRGEIGCG